MSRHALVPKITAPCHPELTGSPLGITCRRMGFVIRLRAGLFAETLLSNLRLRSRLEQPWRDRYARLRRDFQAHAGAPSMSRMWALINIFYRFSLRGGGFRRFKATMGRFLTTYEPHNPKVLEALIHLYVSVLRDRDTWGLLETLEEPELGGGDVVLYRGRRLSIDLLQSIEELYAIREAVGFKQDDPVVFCELGAGYGRLAHVVVRVMPRATYLVIDLPESLLLAQYYLTTLHPTLPSALYPESVRFLRDPEALAAHRLVFGLPHVLPELPRRYVDVFVNTYSFMEMRPEQIERYFQIIDELQVGWLYTKQHKQESSPFEPLVVTTEDYPVRPHWTEVYHRTAAFRDQVFETAYQVRVPGERATPRPSVDARTLSPPVR